MMLETMPSAPSGMSQRRAGARRYKPNAIVTAVPRTREPGAQSPRGLAGGAAIDGPRRCPGRPGPTVRTLRHGEGTGWRGCADLYDRAQLVTLRVAAAESARRSPPGTQPGKALDSPGAWLAGQTKQAADR